MTTPSTLSPADSGAARPGGLLMSAAAFVVVVAGMKAAVNIINPFLLAVFLAIISTPALFWLRKKGISTPLALLIISLVILVAGLLLGGLLAASIAQITQNPPDYTKLEDNFNIAVGWLESKGIHIEKTLMDYLRPDTAGFAGLIRDLLSQLASLMTNGLLIYFTTLFILMEASILPAKIRQAINSKDSFENLAQIADTVKRYLALKTAISLATGVLVMILLIVLKVDYAVLWGLIAFLLNFVPNIGSIIAAIPAVILAMIQHGPLTAGLTLAGYMAINITIGSILEPRIMGQRLGLSTLVVFLSLVFWGWILGPIGMLLSVPLTMTVKIALQMNKETHWMAILLGSSVPALEPPRK